MQEELTPAKLPPFLLLESDQPTNSLPLTTLCQVWGVASSGAQGQSKKASGDQLKK